eukprot:1160347-Pelagomonas_calceolata.AAC.1
MHSVATETLTPHTVRFDGAVKLKAISVIGGGDPSKSPSKMKVWVNREDVDFAAAERMPPVQEWELQPENVGGVLEYPTQVAKFSGVHALDVLFTGNFGAEITEIHFVGLKGEFSECIIFMPGAWIVKWNALDPSVHILLFRSPTAPDRSFPSERIQH